MNVSFHPRCRTDTNHAVRTASSFNLHPAYTQAELDAVTMLTTTGGDSSRRAARVHFRSHHPFFRFVDLLISLASPISFPP